MDLKRAYEIIENRYNEAYPKDLMLVAFELVFKHQHEALTLINQRSKKDKSRDINRLSLSGLKGNTIEEGSLSNPEIESESLKKLMEMGYNVGIECKGKGRVYEMSFEATATRIQQEDEEYKDYVLSTIYNHFHAVGDTVEEVSAGLLEQVIKAKSVKK
ncbi:hypothetical protein CVD28_00780 [Bacillus sp. M6-12]|uniref:hypothetical protein n=1 Tax=Bacillus sp. M6-12 TaxID=2054166 RepID=UPI000C776B21|nr:hypothetical protein [Bacillus sp. M6-12]PLS18968.1 hypothetical protein CVD28_00780 [Bacillus sp. M6-12]